MGIDVTVAGLGPSGAIATLLLARKGFKVKAVDPTTRYVKACGDAVVIHPKYDDYLRKSQSIVWRVSRFEIYISNNNFKRSIRFKDPVWYIINKDKFIKYLRESALAEGAVIQKSIIKNLNKNKFIIDARGPYAHPRKYQIITYRAIVKTKLWNNNKVVLFFLPNKSGLIWAFPASRGEGYVNIGGGFRGATYHDTRQNTLKYIKTIINEFTVIEEAAAPIAVYSRINPTLGRIIKVGEAGGFINSAGGEGIRLALLTGMAAAESFNYENPVEKYRRLTRRYVRESRLSRILLQIVEKSPPSQSTKMLWELPEEFWRVFLSGRLSFATLAASTIIRPRLLSQILRALSAFQFSISRH